MSTSAREVSTVVRSAQLIHAAITLGLISFGAVVLFLILSGSDAAVAEESTPPKNDIAFAVLDIAAPIGGTVFAFLIRAFIGRGARGPDASGIIMMRHIMFIAVLEGGGLLGVISSLLSGNLIGFAAAAIPLIVLLATWPTRARFDPDYDPRTASFD